MSSQQLKLEKIDDTKNPLINQQADTTVASKITDDDTLKFEEAPVNEPKDRLGLVYLVFLLHGMAILLPWNIFITNSEYYTKHKLNTDISRGKWYQEDFLFYSSIIGQVSNVLMNAFNMFFTRSGSNPKGRMPYAIMLCALVLIFTIVLAILDTSTWPFGFFITTLVSVVVIFLGTGVYNTCVFFIASWFPMQYTSAIVFGNNISGIFTTVMSIISKATTPNLRIAAIYYFLSGVVLLLICFILYFLAPHIRYFRHNEMKAKQRQQEQSANKETSNEPILRVYWTVVKKIWLLLVSIFICMFSTLSIFPIYQSQIILSDPNFFVPEFWFTDVTCFLTFNIFVTLGVIFSNFQIFRKPGPKWIPIPVFAKAILTMLFVVFCNFRPNQRKNIPVLIKNDYVYWAGSIITPLVSGHLLSLLMMYTPKQVEPKYAGNAAMLSALTLVIGVVAGLQFSNILCKIVLL